jgi:hypothetical protein
MSSFAVFYLLAPWIYRAFRTFQKAFVAEIVLLWATPYIVGGIQSLFASYPQEAHIEWFSVMNPLSELYCFMLGAVLYLAVKENREFLYLGLIIVALVFTRFEWRQYEFISVILVAVAVMFSSEYIKSGLVQTILEYASKGSFALYLIHPIVLRLEPWIQKILQIMGLYGKWTLAAALYIACIGVAYFIYFVIIFRIEQHFRKT